MVVEPAYALPYGEGELREARDWLDQLPRGAAGICQGDLVAAWTAVGGGRDDRPDLQSSWLDGGVVTETRELRKASPSLTILLPDDADAVQQRRDSATRLAVPMNMPPKSLKWVGWRKVAYLPVPPRGVVTYDPERGAAWR